MRIMCRVKQFQGFGAAKEKGQSLPRQQGLEGGDRGQYREKRDGQSNSKGGSDNNVNHFSVCKIIGLLPRYSGLLTLEWLPTSNKRFETLESFYAGCASAMIVNREMHHMV